MGSLEQQGFGIVSIALGRYLHFTWEPGPMAPVLDSNPKGGQAFFLAALFPVAGAQAFAGSAFQQGGLALSLNSASLAWALLRYEPRIGPGGRAFMPAVPLLQWLRGYEWPRIFDFCSMQRKIVESRSR